MRVSIIVPVYNVSAYIERCIKSVMCQSFKDSMECIIVDDCTPDDSIEKCETLISAYDGPISFLILHHEKNRGLSAARNTGTMAAKGEYIYYIDSDDEITTDAIEKVYAEVLKHPGVEMVQGTREIIPQQVCDDISFLNEIDYIDDNSWIRYHIYRNVHRLPVTAWNKLILKKFLLDNSLLFKEGLIHEDELWMYKVSKILAKYSVAHSVTYKHYITPNSIMTTDSKERSAYHWSIILSEVIDDVDNPYMYNQLLTYTLLLYNLYGVKKYRKNYKKLTIKFLKYFVSMHEFKVAFLLIGHFFLYSYVNNTFLYPKLNRAVRVKLLECCFKEEPIVRTCCQ